jgi:hypothetical protein
MMRTLFLAFLILGVSTGAAQSSSVFEQRRQRLLDVASAESETSFFAAAARISRGIDLGTAYGMIDSLTRDHVMGGMFYAYTLVGTYLLTRDALPDSLRRKIRDAYRTRTMYRGDTENHWVMYYTGLYLASQTWPGEPGETWFNGKSSEENFEESRSWLEHWMRITTTIGQGEFDSPTYSTVFLTPMLVLQEFAADTIMRKRARMMVDLLFADFAAEHLAGNYGGGHSRDYPDDIINPLAAPSTMWAWLYFGQPEFEQWNETRYRPRHRTSWETVLGALVSYRLPEIIRLIATDRSEPYVQHETKRVRNIIRFGTEMNPPVYKYTYVTDQFILGSLQGGILQPIQQHTWDVTFVSEKPNNTVFSLHPFVSGRELAMFFPEEQKFLADEVNRYHLVYTSPDKWNSSSPYEQTFQHRNTLIVLYDIAEGVRYGHIDAFFPRTLKRHRMGGSGWIVCQGGETFIGVYPLKPYEWIEENVNWRLRSNERRNGLIVEVVPAASFPSFDAFETALARNTIDLSSFEDACTVSYTTLEGDRMRFTFDGPRVLNGQEVDFPRDKLFESPFMQSARGSGVITLRHGGLIRVLDFPAATVRDR